MLQVSLNYPTTSIKAVPFSRWRTHPAGRARASRAVDQTLWKARSVKTAKRLSKVQPATATDQLHYMASAEKQKGLARQSLADRLRACREPMTMLKETK